MQISKLAFIFLSFLWLIDHASAQEKPGALISTFEEVCMAGNGKPEFVRDWAQRRHLQEVDSVDGRKIYTGGTEGGHAWWMQVGSTFIVVAFRVSSATCAVFSSASDSGEIQTYLRKLPERVSGKWPTHVTLPDKNESGAFGLRAGRAFLFSRLPQPGTMLVTSIFNEKPGGAYQATLQAAFSSED